MAVWALAFGRMIEGVSVVAGQGGLWVCLVRVEIGVGVGMFMLGGWIGGGWMRSLGWSRDRSLVDVTGSGSFWIEWVATGSVDLGGFGGGLGTAGGGFCWGYGVGKIRKGDNNDGGSASLLVRRGWWWYDFGFSGAVVVRLVRWWGVLGLHWAGSVGHGFLPFDLAGIWAWTLSLGLCFIFYGFCVFYFLVVIGSWPLISRYHVLVGLDGLCPGLCTLCAWSALGRWRVLVKWTQPPSGRMKCSVAGLFFSRQHSGKADLIVLSHSSGVIFPVCHRNCKAIEVANRATLANWCLFEYKFIVETPDIILGSSLETHCNMGLRFYAGTEPGIYIRGG